MLDKVIGMDLEGKELCPTCDRECGTLADNDAAVDGDGNEEGKIIRMSKHVSRSPGVYVPIIISDVVVRCRSGMQCGKEHRVPGHRRQDRRGGRRRHGKAVATVGSGGGYSPDGMGSSPGCDCGAG